MNGPRWPGEEVDPLVVGTTYAEACTEYERRGRHVVFEHNNIPAFRLGSVALVRSENGGFCCVDSRFMGFRSLLAARRAIRYRDSNAWDFRHGYPATQCGEFVQRSSGAGDRASWAVQCGWGIIGAER